MTNVIKKVGYSHEAVIETILANPGITQRELARKFEYSEAWLSQVINSDAFRERLAAKKEDVVDPVLRMSLEERIRGMADLSLKVIMEKLEEAKGVPGLTGMNPAIRAFEHSTRALGYGAGAGAKVNVSTYVAIVPPKAVSSEAWVEEHSPERIGVRETGVVLDALVVEGRRERVENGGS